MSDNVKYVIGSQRSMFEQSELFVTPAGHYEDQLVLDALQFVEENLVEVRRDGRCWLAISARKVWEWLGCPATDFRQWFRRTCRYRKFQEGKHFVELIDRVSTDTTKAGRGGDRRSKDYALTAKAAKEVLATDRSPKGKAMLRGLVLLAEKYKDGDQGMLLEMIDKQTDLEFLASIPDRLWRRACQVILEAGGTIEDCHEWLEKRGIALDRRKNFTRAAASSGVSTPKEYQDLTNLPYQILDGRDAKALRQAHGLSGRETPRNRMTTGQLLEVALTEHRAAEAFGQRNARGFRDCISIVQEVATRLAKSRLAASLGGAHVPADHDVGGDGL